MILEKQFVLEIANTSFNKTSRRKIVSKRHIFTVFSSHFIKALFIFRCIYYYYANTKVEMFLRLTSKQTYRIFLFLCILFAIHHS